MPRGSPITFPTHCRLRSKWPVGNENIGPLAPWTLWWDADPQKEIILKGRLMKFQGETIFAPPGVDRPQMVADLLGDWREELVTAVEGKLWIYSTTIPAQTSPHLPHARPAVPPLRGHELDGLQHAAATLEPIEQPGRSPANRKSWRSPLCSARHK